jgi:hypothetical protein
VEHSQVATARVLLQSVPIPGTDEPRARIGIRRRRDSDGTFIAAASAKKPDLFAEAHLTLAAGQEVRETPFIQIV